MDTASVFKTTRSASLGTADSVRLLAQAAMLESAAFGVALIDAQGRYAFVNERLARMLGRSADEIVGLDVLETVAAEGQSAVREALVRRRAGVSEQLDVPLLCSDGHILPVLLAASPLFDERGAFVGSFGTLTDMTDRQRAEQALHLLAGATATLAQSLDYEATLANVARAVVPCLADACIIQLSQDRDLQRIALAGVDAAGRESAGAIEEWLRSRDDPLQERVARTGDSERLVSTGEALPPANGHSPGTSDLGRFGMRSVLVVPLKVRRETLGVMTAMSRTRVYDEQDRELLEEIGSRAALAIDHARLHRAVASQRTRLRVIADTSRALGAQLDAHGVARAISRILHAAVVLGHSSDGVLEVSACAAVDPEVEARLRVQLGAMIPFEQGSPLRNVLQGEEPRWLDHDGARALPAPCTAVAHETGDGGLLVAPLLVQGRPIGAMLAARGRGSPPLAGEDPDVLRELSERAAVALERANLFESQQRATERLRLLADAGTLLAQSLEVTPTLTSLARLAASWFADTCSVDLFEGGVVSSVAVAAADAALEAALRAVIDRFRRVRLPPPALRRLLESHRAQLVRDVSRDSLRDFAVDEVHLDAIVGLGLRSIIVVPLAARGAIVGAMSLGRRGGAPYDAEDLALAADLGRRAALAVDNARLFTQATLAIAARDEFLAIASHELNTPLTPLKMQLDSLRRGTFSPERVAQKLEAASRQVTRLAKLVSQLLDVSRISGGRLHIEPERFDLALLVDEVVANMSESAERAGSPLHVSVDRPCFGVWDRLRLDQVVTNLITNAVKYGAAKPIEIALTAQPDRARLVVSDHGIGIAPEHQRRIFERFERAASVRHYGGFGLGLWIARQIVEASGGSIAVESAPGRGSTFVVELPRRE